MTSPILVCGDTHTNTDFAVRAIAKARHSGCRELWVVGDFGYWPRTSAGKAFLSDVTGAATAADIDIFFCDGNREDHLSLPHDKTEPVELARRVSFVPRGVVRTVAGKRIMFFGGAVSMRIGSRIRTWDVFDNETASESQLARAAASGDVDVMVAHDVPAGIDLGGDGAGRFPQHLLDASHRNRTRMAELAAAVNPQLWLAGHFHRRASSVNDAGMAVEVLASDRDPDQAMVLLDLATGVVSNV